MGSKSNSGKEFYPVIHCIYPSEFDGTVHALNNVRVAIDNNADGVFLIGHGVDSRDLCKIYKNMREAFPDVWIGVNFLNVSINRHKDAMNYCVRQCKGLNAIWTDEMPHTSYDLGVPIFAGVAFKYIDPNQSGKALVQSCAQALKFADVATTSGDKTGSPPSLEKLMNIRQNIGEMQLAVASGVNAENVTAMKQYVDKFLVASSIITRDPNRGNQEHLVPEKVRELAGLIHA